MACEFLQGNALKTCGAMRAQVASSVDELQNFCMSGRYHMCPVYKRRIEQGMQIPVHEYPRYNIFCRG